jgi:hypothetical protein
MASAGLLRGPWLAHFYEVFPLRGDASAGVREREFAEEHPKTRGLWGSEPGTDACRAKSFRRWFGFELHLNHFHRLIGQVFRQVSSRVRPLDPSGLHRDVLSLSVGHRKSYIGVT